MLEPLVQIKQLEPQVPHLCIGDNHLLLTECLPWRVTALSMSHAPHSGEVLRSPNAWPASAVLALGSLGRSTGPLCWTEDELQAGNKRATEWQAIAVGGTSEVAWPSLVFWRRRK